VILSQSVCEVCAVGEGELARALATLDPRPKVVTLHAHTLDGVFADIRRVGEALDLADEAEELTAGMTYRCTTSRPLCLCAAAPRVLVVEWLDPPYWPATGCRSWWRWPGVGTSARPREPSRRRTWRDLAALAPERRGCGPVRFDVPRARHEYET